MAYVYVVNVGRINQKKDPEQEWGKRWGKGDIGATYPYVGSFSVAKKKKILRSTWLEQGL